MRKDSDLSDRNTRAQIKSAADTSNRHRGRGRHAGRPDLWSNGHETLEDILRRKMGRNSATAALFCCWAASVLPRFWRVIVDKASKLPEEQSRTTFCIIHSIIRLTVDPRPVVVPNFGHESFYCCGVSWNGNYVSGFITRRNKSE
jgi:hypothetical protein